MSGDHNMYQKPYSYLDFECQIKGEEREPLFWSVSDGWVYPDDTSQERVHTRAKQEHDLARVGEVGVWGQCEPQQALEDGWCDWVCPKPYGYLMQCCDCELIHEVDFRVAKYESESSEAYEVVDDPNLQAQMRMKRRDDISPKREWVGLTDEEREHFRGLGFVGVSVVEAKLKERNG